MITSITICLAAFAVSGLTLYSGFGLGTLLMPVFALFFPVETAVAATAIVHGANSLFKVAVVGRHADFSLIVRFGLPAIVAAILGAAMLGYLSQQVAVFSYSLGPVPAAITPLKLIMAVLMAAFAIFELNPTLKKLRFSRKYLVLGGLLSGFFGGFSGHQGALRSAFLVKVGITTEAFIGTSATIGFLVDLTRITTYAALLVTASANSPLQADHWSPIILGTVSAFLGVLLGKRYLHKVTMQTVQSLTGSLLLLIAMALGSGLI